MSSIDYEQVRQNVGIANVLMMLGWERTSHRGDEWRGRCPLCGRGGRHPSFAADVRRDVWYCHRCRRGGGVLELAARAWRMTVYDAARELCRRLGQRVPYLPRSKVRRPRKPRPTRNGEES